ncbi:MAG: hypothetical protein A3B86_04215 [Candidatus Yanofskybacteria bacterium RIFCSPHIGHO2_02_FULL_38_22b]|uniref:Uncharacterized protein n=1 Tax=Candidatus Yanofskybacteria bacterium RIFCSPHIGHO2_02_FULL_38_22b TaxID=1802673 RepID=A0A1F8EZK6_9BACT|nr:MAG: hypothetical protein A2816_01985 [Candidatus Yanofskybacteria bacterium RIFCSPHIGHO2_01_FULL_39_44]OGN06295.1 MAG: hypothetical protein A3B86_04215 [Candidatus Yanofskybacteria bacterium RIFCSPHIGHO2_02_FULL_38_22b]OGN19715.1 MAG: hypothetical protein A2910_03950 [Candidatus Yanofskybacteria bacterium RIFCSPLOWO2_01_FULL_39_28]
MTIENPQNNTEQLPQLQTIDDIEFELITEGDPDFDDAISVVNTNGKKTEQELLDDAKKEIIRRSWWLQDQWRAKGLPQEQVSIRAEGLDIELYNYGQQLSPAQLEDLKRVITTLSQVSISDQNSKIRYIAINNKDELNDQNGEDKRGYAFPASKMVALYPRAVSVEPHRISNTSGLAGTVAHEFGHIYISADS